MADFERDEYDHYDYDADKLGAHGGKGVRCGSAIFIDIQVVDNINEIFICNLYYFQNYECQVRCKGCHGDYTVHCVMISPMI